MEREWGNGEEMDREWENGERTRKWREIHSLHFLIFSFFPPSLSIYPLWENISGSNSLRDSSASCAGLPWWWFLRWGVESGINFWNLHIWEIRSCFWIGEWAQNQDIPNQIFGKFFQVKIDFRSSRQKVWLRQWHWLWSKSASIY